MSETDFFIIFIVTHANLRETNDQSRAQPPYLSRLYNVHSEFEGLDHRIEATVRAFNWPSYARILR